MLPDQYVGNCTLGLWQRVNTQMSQACCVTASLLLLRNASTVVRYRRPSLDSASLGELQSFSHVYVCAFACRQAHVYTRGHAWTSSEADVGARTEGMRFLL